MPVLRNVDVFVKPRADLRSKSVAGGVITLVASTTALVLFLAQWYLYLAGSPAHTLHLSESIHFPMLPNDMKDPFQSRAYDIKMKMPLKIHVTFLHLHCDALEVKLNSQPIAVVNDDDKKSKKKKPQHNHRRDDFLTVRRPNPIELKRIFGKDNDAISSSNNQGGRRSGCTISGQLRVPIVAGHVSITLTRQAWTEALNYHMARAQWSHQRKAEDVHRNDYNMSHYIHSIQFGKKLPSYAASTAAAAATTTAKHPHLPLERRLHSIENLMGGIALENIQVKLIPTVMDSSGLLASLSSLLFLNSQQRQHQQYSHYQMSVVEHMIQPETMVEQGGGLGMTTTMQPGLSLGYDLTPLAVHHHEGRDNLLVFLSSLIGIVGGCFVTMGLLTGCLVHSAQAAVSKKVD